MKLFNTIMTCLVVLLICWFFIGLCSCKLTKEIDKVRSDTAIVSKKDSGSVKINETNETKDEEWWREILKLGGNDTTINHFINTPGTVTYIREGGRSSEEKKTLNYDSAWLSKTDSLFSRMERMNKQTKTTVLNMWQIIGVCAAFSLGFFLLSKLKFKIP